MSLLQKASISCRSAFKSSYFSINQPISSTSRLQLISNHAVSTSPFLSQWLLPFNSTRTMGSKALIKTNKSAAKRMRVRGSGSIKR